MKFPPHKLKVVVSDDPRYCKVELNGKELEGVVSVKFDIDASKRVFARLDIITEIEVEGEFKKIEQGYQQMIERQAS